MNRQDYRLIETSRADLFYRKKTLNYLVGIITFAAWFFLLSSCTPVNYAPGLGMETPDKEAVSGNLVETVILPTPTRATEEPLHFSFPTPYSPPVSLWRPPQYEVPFAMSPFDHFFFTRPIGSEDINWPLADYRYGGIFFGTEIIHTGIDLPNPKGTPVLAAASGKVIWAGNGLYTNDPKADDPYGLAVVIKHDFGYNGHNLNTVYAHMDRVDVQVGQEVDSGDQLGIVGTTGATTGPHLHFEVRVETNSFYSTRNPELWLVPPEGWGVLAGRVMKSNGDILYTYRVDVTSVETGEEWTLYTYGGLPANSDEYYQENMVLSDLPQGAYRIAIIYGEETYRYQVNINPGRITYFTFTGTEGFSGELPAPVTP